MKDLRFLHHFSWRLYLPIAGVAILFALTLHQGLLLKPSIEALEQTTTQPALKKAEIRYDALFGRYEGKDRPLQETGLNLQLTGVFTTQDPFSGSAVISDSGRKSLLVTVGDKLPGGVTLLEVYPDHIVLEQAGEQSVLRLPKKSL